MFEPKKSFIELILSGKTSVEKIDDFIDEWHENPSELSLSQFLGLTEEEYAVWVRDPSALPGIVDARLNGQPLNPVIPQA